MHRTVTLEQASVTLEKWILAVRGGDTVTITHDGRPVATLRSAGEPAPRAVPEARIPRLDPALTSLLGWEDAEEVLRMLGE